jgi:hypothetical protein
MKETTTMDYIYETEYNSSVRYDNVEGDFVGEDLNRIKHWGQTYAECRDRISTANRIIAKHRATNPRDVAADCPDARAIATRDGAAFCDTCGLRNNPLACQGYQDYLEEAGRVESIRVVNEQTAELSGAFSPRCDM